MYHDVVGRRLTSLVLALLSSSCAAPAPLPKGAEICKGNRACIQMLRRVEEGQQRIAARKERGPSPALRELLPRLRSGELPPPRLEEGTSGVYSLEPVTFRVFDRPPTTLLRAGAQLPARVLGTAFPIQEGAQVMTVKYFAGDRPIGGYQVLLVGEGIEGLTVSPIAVELSVDAKGNVELAETTLLPESGGRFTVDVPGAGPMTFPGSSDLTSASVSGGVELGADPRVKVGPLAQVTGGR